MKVVLDEMLPAAVAGLLSGHEVATAKTAGYTGLSNGDLIRRAARDGFDVLLTADRNLPEQQHIPAGNLAIVLVRGSRMPISSRRPNESERRSPMLSEEPSRESSANRVVLTPAPSDPATYPPLPAIHRM